MSQEIVRKFFWAKFMLRKHRSSNIFVVKITYYLAFNWENKTEANPKFINFDNHLITSPSLHFCFGHNSSGAACLVWRNVWKKPTI